MNNGMLDLIMQDEEIAGKIKEFLDWIPDQGLTIVSPFLYRNGV